MRLVNPYVSLDMENPSIAQMRQKPLRGPGLEERAASCKVIKSVYGQILQGQQYNLEDFKKYYELMATDIKKEKNRIGGHWAVANVVLKKEMRDFLR